MKTRLRDLFDVHTLADEIRIGFVHEGHDMSDPEHHVLCYTPAAQFDRHWNDVTRNCRGLTARYAGDIADGSADIDEVADAICTSRGIPKFFTVDAIATAPDDSDNIMLSLEDDDEMVAQLRGITVTGSVPVHVADKVDGAMCVSYVTRDGALAFHTKGSFASDEANIANRIIAEYPELTNTLAQIVDAIDCTPVFEVVTPEYLHIVNYDGLETLFYLGLVDNRSGEWTPSALDTSPLKEAVEDYFPLPETFAASTLAEALELPSRPNREGVVITVFSTPQRMLKVKYEAFLALQSLKRASKATQTELLMQMLVRNISSVNELEALPTDELMALCGIDSELVEYVEPSMLKRIALLICGPSIEVANQLREGYQYHFDLVQKLWRDVDEDGHDERTYVTHVLQNVDAPMRPFAFAAKNLYLNDRRDELSALCATNVVKHNKKATTET